ncbi:MAG: Crotonobetainyl-CoA:carnitine CoA-transferase CaiB, partial [Chloroflexi bacterium]
MAASARGGPAPLGPLDGLRVLAVGADVATRYASWWLSECGADVVAYRPRWQADPADAGEVRFERLVGRGVGEADFENDAAYGAIFGDADSLAALQDGIPLALREEASVVEVTSPFPGGASFAGVQSHDIALWARSGLGYLTRETTAALELGDPCLPLNRQPSFLAGMAAAFAVAADALARETGAAGSRRIGFDKLELLALTPMQPIAFAQMEDRIVGKNPEVLYPGGVMKALDGVAYVRPVDPPHWASLFGVAGELEWAAESVVETPSLLLEARDLLDARLREWVASETRDGLVAKAQAAHVPVAPICQPSEMPGDAHLAARGFFGTSGEAPALRLPWLSRVDPAGAEPPAKTATGAVRSRPASPALPLAGLRVLDLTWAWAGPFATTLLADLGAEVVNIEKQPNKSTLRRNPPFLGGREESDDTAGWWSANQRGKFSLGVNMKSPEGAQIIRELAAECDVVVENFSPGVVDRLGVGYEDLLAVNPRLVYVSMSAYGQTGPQAHYINYGTQLYAASGASYATSRDGSMFSQMWIPYPDPVSGLAGAFAIAAYAYGARVSGRPAYVDLSEFESLCCITLESL